MAIRAVVFDIGDVLEPNPRTGWAESGRVLLQLSPGEFGVRVGPAVHAGSIGTIMLADYERQVGELLEIDAAQVDALMIDAWQEYVGTLNQEIAAYFASLRPRYRTAILSNSFVGAREREDELYMFADMCDMVIYSHEEGVMKPERRIYEILVERLGVAPHEIVFLDDREENIAAARDFGIQAVVFHDTDQAIADVEAILHANVSNT